MAFRSSYKPRYSIKQDNHQTAIFYLKLETNSEIKQQLHKVYIRYQCLNEFDQQFQEEEMQILKEKENEVHYIVKLQLWEKGKYKYQYVQEIMDQQEKETEQNFRTFSEQTGVNLVDEWNKVWCLYRVRWENQSLFENYEITLEREGLDSLKFKNTRTFFLTWDCKELQENDNSQKTRRFVFRNRENNEIIKSNEFSAANGQDFHMNQIDWDFSQNLLPKEELQKFKTETSKLNQALELKNVFRTEENDQQSQKDQRDLEEQILKNSKLIKEVKDELKKKEQDNQLLVKENNKLKQEIRERQNQSAIRLNQFEIQKKLDLKNEKKQHQEILDKIHQQFNEQLNNISREKEEIESFANAQLTKLKQEIEQLQQQLCQQIVDSSVQQGAANATKIQELEANVQILESEEIRKSYEDLKNSYDQLEKEKQEWEHYSQSNQRKAQVLQIKCENLQKSALQCSNNLEIYKQKLVQFEVEQQNQLKTNEKNQQIIKKIKEQLSQSQKDLNQYKERLKVVQQQLQKEIEQNSQLQEQIQRYEEQYQKQNDENKQALKKLKSESDKMIQQILENKIVEQEKLQQEIKQKQEEEKRLRKNQLLNFIKNNLDFLKANVIEDYFQLQNLYSAEVIKNLNAEMCVLIKEKLDFIKIYIFKSNEEIQKLSYLGFDKIKNDSVQEQQNILKQIRSMKEKMDEQNQQQLFQSITKFQQFGQKIQDVVKNQENIDETKCIEQINKYLKKLDLTRDSIIQIVETNQKYQQLQNEFTSQIKSKNFYQHKSMIFQDKSTPMNIDSFIKIIYNLNQYIAKTSQNQLSCKYFFIILSNCFGISNFLKIILKLSYIEYSSSSKDYQKIMILMIKYYDFQLKPKL